MKLIDFFFSLKVNIFNDHNKCSLLELVVFSEIRYIGLHIAYLVINFNMTLYVDYHFLSNVFILNSGFKYLNHVRKKLGKTA